jgi:hypothetical protein
MTKVLVLHALKVSAGLAHGRALIRNAATPERIENRNHTRFHRCGHRKLRLIWRWFKREIGLLITSQERVDHRRRDPQTLRFLRWEVHIWIWGEVSYCKTTNPRTWRYTSRSNDRRSVNDRPQLWCSEPCRMVSGGLYIERSAWRAHFSATSPSSSVGRRKVLNLEFF